MSIGVRMGATMMRGQWRGWDWCYSGERSMEVWDECYNGERSMEGLGWVLQW